MSDVKRYSDCYIGYKHIEMREVPNGVYVTAHDFDALSAENQKLREALEDILEWCENAKKTAGVEPYGLAVARAALSKEPK